MAVSVAGRLEEGVGDFSSDLVPLGFDRVSSSSVNPDRARASSQVFSGSLASEAAREMELSLASCVC